MYRRQKHVVRSSGQGGKDLSACIIHYIRPTTRIR